tara:strand:+ start:2592 stop:2843 length:252 start_codon:yes stop_codon:yes gene_type:complete
MASNSILKVDTIQSTDGGAPTLASLPSIPSGKEFVLEGGVEITGTLTASSFTGNGGSLTDLTAVNRNKIFAYKTVLGFDEFRS